MAIKRRRSAILATFFLSLDGVDAFVSLPPPRHLSSVSPRRMVSMSSTSSSPRKGPRTRDEERKRTARDIVGVLSFRRLPSSQTTLEPSYIETAKNGKSKLQLVHFECEAATCWLESRQFWSMVIAISFLYSVKWRFSITDSLSPQR